MLPADGLVLISLAVHLFFTPILHTHSPPLACPSLSASCALQLHLPSAEEAPERALRKLETARGLGSATELCVVGPLTLPL